MRALCGSEDEKLLSRSRGRLKKKIMGWGRKEENRKSSNLGLV